MSLENSGGFRARSAKGDTPPAKKNHSGDRPQAGGGQGRKSRSGAAAGSGRPVHAGGARHARGSQRTAPEVRELGVDKPREITFEVLSRVRTTDSYANLVLPKLLHRHHLSGRDAAFATELTYGTLRNLGLLDQIIAEAAGRALTQIDPEILDLLRLGAYQVLFTRVEDHAAVDTTVKMVNGLKKFKATGFVNAVMRTITRSSREDWLSRLEPAEEIARIAFRTAHPEWIARSFARTLPADEVRDALEADSARPVVHLVARPGEISAEELALITGGEEGRYSPYAVYLEGGDPADIDAVRDGLAAVQDEGSQLIARALVEVPVEGTDSGRWLDLCAGPGGKAALIGALARMDGARVDAVEISGHRARLIEKSVAGLPVRVHIGDGRNIDLPEGYDRVLVDAPCSGLGALRRRPEARWRKQESDIAGLNTLQYELLKSAVDKARPGGVVLYSTCSPDLRETRGIVDRALAELPVEELDAAEQLPGMSAGDGEKSMQMWPHRHGTDAMFLAVLRKK